MNTQTLPWLKFSHESYLFGFRIGAKAAIKAAYLDLLCLCMKSTPSLSIPNDDQTLADWCGLTPKAWLKIKDKVLSQFSLNADNNRYYSNMLVANYAEQETTEEQPQQQTRKPAKTNAQRQAEYRQRQDALRNADRNEPVTPSNEQRNESNENHVTSLDKDLNKNLNKNPVVAVQTQEKTTTRTTTDKLIFIDDYQPNLTTLCNVTKHNDGVLRKFAEYNQGKRKTQAEFDQLYDRWLGLEKPTNIPKKQTNTENLMFGVPKADIERLARAGESYEQAAYRITRERAEKQRNDKYKAA